MAGSRSRNTARPRRASGRCLMQQDYYFVLSSLIMASARDNPELRSKIYNLRAASCVANSIGKQKTRAQPTGTRRLLALEIAIEQIEADLAKIFLRAPTPARNVPTWRRLQNRDYYRHHRCPVTNFERTTAVRVRASANLPRNIGRYCR